MALAPPARPKENTCMMYLIRHGATLNNVAVPPVLQGRGSDPELSDEGQEQARRAGEFLKEYPIDAFYSSPLTRAKQTAEAITKPHGLNIQELEEIIECDVGSWENRDWEEIEKKRTRLLSQVHG